MELSKEAREQFLRDYLDYSTWFLDETGKTSIDASMMDFSMWLVNKVLDEKLNKALE